MCIRAAKSTTEIIDTCVCVYIYVCRYMYIYVCMYSWQKRQEGCMPEGYSAFCEWRKFFFIHAYILK